ncbi:thiamine pyrophosphate-binding protein [Pusillimonas caeni]|uniref:thiamine pyrophosphate-binding protein n=1 Tax=Pusillimonas caeni TaxID=1348472 RepID=UPI000E59B72C|nr:thiamine pyrophosphate-binding protein [Pusillimonas caeni]TFL13340.1 thiamine pyrophosphate-binding protein [Pusillimonas caeni]
MNTLARPTEVLPPADDIGNDAPPPAVVPSAQRWGSDVIVDLLHQYKMPYAALNPGASYRGLHDSIVNYGDNYPRMMLCQHEETAVQIAHGYAKASGKPMVAILHNLVGLLHANMAVYYAYVDRAPIFIVGATGPMDESKRRPHIDWIHTAHVQGQAVRDYTKWDYQPHTVDGVPESFARAYGVMMTEPQGPIYMCYDAWLQEKPLEHDVPLPPAEAMAVPTPMAPDPAALSKAADMLAQAQRPVILVEYAGRHHPSFDALVELAETLGAPVFDINARLNFPNRHPLNMSMVKDVFRDADLMLCLDVRDWEKPTTELVSTTRQLGELVPVSAKWIDIGFSDVELSSWAMDYQRLLHADLRILADTAVAIPALTGLLHERIGRDTDLAGRIARRGEETAGRHRAARAKWQEQARRDWDASPMTAPRLASEIWEVIRHEDWVLTANTLEDWTRKLWDFDKPYRHPGKSLGTATQFGISLGVALAHRDHGRLVVDIQPDGDLMFDAGALWVAAKHRIPMLVVMYNNRAYYNDWEHQVRMAKHRGTALDRAHIGMDMDDPAPDFAALARSMGWYAEGPIEHAGDVGPALRRAIEQVKAGKPALLDTITQKRFEFKS